MAYFQDEKFFRFRNGLEIVLDDDQTRIGNVNNLQIILDEEAQSLADLGDGIMTEKDYVLERRARENRLKDYLLKQGVVWVSEVKILEGNTDFFLSLNSSYDELDEVWYAELEENVLRIIRP